jgi:hypothetical protein
MIDELEMIWKEVVMKYYTSICLNRLRKPQKNLKE